MFLKKIKFKKDIVFESNRKDHKKHFKVKSRTYSYENLRKPIYEDVEVGGRTYRGGLGRHIGYEKTKVTEKSFVIFPKGFEVEFKEELTIIVGDNGCGKSSLMKYLSPPDFERNPRYIFDSRSKEEVTKELIKNWVDGEKIKIEFCGNPQMIINENQIHKNAFIENLKSSTSHGRATPEDILNIWEMGKSSNGENTLDFINGLVEFAHDSLIILDEPETSLSIKSQKNVAKNIRKMLKNGNQVIIITHSPIIMELSNEIYNFETKQFEDTKAYIEKQMR